MRLNLCPDHALPAPFFVSFEDLDWPMEPMIWVKATFQI